MVERNHVHHLGNGVLSDIGGIYTNSISPGTRIRYNVVHDVRHRDYGGWGIYNDQGSADILVEKNLVYRCSSGPLFVSNARDITVRGNIFASGAQYQVFRAGYATNFQFSFSGNLVYYQAGRVVGEWDTAQRNYRFARNLYWNASGEPLSFGGQGLADWQAAGQDRDSLVADPLFVAPERGDFRLRPGSPAAKIGFEPWDLSNIGPRHFSLRRSR